MFSKKDNRLWDALVLTMISIGFIVYMVFQLYPLASSDIDYEPNIIQIEKEQIISAIDDFNALYTIPLELIEFHPKGYFYIVRNSLEKDLLSFKARDYPYSGKQEPDITMLVKATKLKYLFISIPSIFVVMSMIPYIWGKMWTL